MTDIVVELQHPLTPPASLEWRISPAQGLRDWLTREIDVQPTPGGVVAAAYEQDGQFYPALLIGNALVTLPPPFHDGKGAGASFWLEGSRICGLVSWAQRRADGNLVGSDARLHYVEAELPAQYVRPDPCISEVAELLARIAHLEHAFAAQVTASRQSLDALEGEIKRVAKVGMYRYNDQAKVNRGYAAWLGRHDAALAALKQPDPA